MIKQILPEDIIFLRGAVEHVVATMVEAFSRGLTTDEVINVAFAYGHQQMSMDDVYATCCTAMALLAEERVNHG